MAYTIQYSNERVRNGSELESSCIVMDGVTEVCRFSVLGYTDEADRDVQAKALLEQFIALIGYGKPAPTHPVMKASLVVTAEQMEP